MVIKAHIALLAVGIIYGLNYSIAKLVMNGGYVGPSGFILFRVLFGVLFFTALLRSKVFYFPFTKSEWIRIAICGALGVAINQLSFFRGLEITSPINAALILTLTPMIVLILSFLFRREVFKWYKLLGVLSGAFGAALLITNGFKTIEFSAFNKGDLLVFVNVVSYASYLIVVVPLIQKYDALVVVRAVFLLGLLYVTPFGIQEALMVDWSQFDLNVLVSFSYVLLCTTGLAYWLNAYALKIVSAPIVSIYIYLQPLVAALAGLYFGQHHLTLLHLTTGILIFGGIIMISIPKLIK